MTNPVNGLPIWQHYLTDAEFAEVQDMIARIKELQADKRRLKHRAEGRIREGKEPQR